MANNVWSELATDGAWDPWVLGQLFATLAGWENGESVAINATSIDDPAQFAAHWRNLGGGGAGDWRAADNSVIAQAPDSGWVFGKDITGTGASFSGAVDIGGALTGTTASFSGAVDVASLDSAGDVTAGGNVEAGGNVAADGSVSGASGSFTGAVTAGSVSTGALTATGAVALGDADADPITIVGKTTFRNAAGALTQLVVDAANNRVIVGAATPMGSDVTPALQVAGRLYLAPETANDLALQIRRSSAAVVGWSIGMNATNDLVFKDDGGLEIFRIGDTSSAAQILAAGVFRHMGTSAGFYGATPVTQPTLPAAAGATYTAAEQSLLNSIRTLLRNVGLSA